MFGVFVLVAIVATVWWACGPTRRFRQEFARLVEAPHNQSYYEDLQWVTAVAARYRNRRVSLQIVHPAGESESLGLGLGRVVLSMEVRAPDGEPWKDSRLTSGNPELSRATFDLEGRHGLILTLCNGSLAALWHPPRGRMFPGPCDAPRWRNTLEQMHVLAEWLERRAEG